MKLATFIRAKERYDKLNAEIEMVRRSIGNVEKPTLPVVHLDGEMAEMFRLDIVALMRARLAELERELEEAEL